jgi:hypothetical protein
VGAINRFYDLIHSSNTPRIADFEKKMLRTPNRRNVSVEDASDSSSDDYARPTPSTHQRKRRPAKMPSVVYDNFYTPENEFF